VDVAAAIKEIESSYWCISGIWLSLAWWLSVDGCTIGGWCAGEEGE
jgi:hypothetical protein